MALAHTPSTSSAAFTSLTAMNGAGLDTVDAMPQLGPSWLVAQTADPAAMAEPAVALASVHPIRSAVSADADTATQPEAAPQPGIESHPAFQHQAFYDPAFQYPGYEHPAYQAPELVEVPVEQWATVLPFVPAPHAQTLLPVVAVEEAAPLDYRPVWMGAAFFASTLCVYASSAPVWVADPIALESESVLQRLAATSFQLIGVVPLTMITGIASIAFLLAGTQRL